MRQALSLVLMTALLLCGCKSDASRQEKLEERQRIFAEGGISFRADVTADFGEELFSCVLDCETGAGETVLRVVEPELVAGVTARFSEEDAVLEYDGLRLELGEMPGSALGPLQAAAELAGAMCSVHVSGAFEEEGGALLGAQIYISDTSYALIWYDAGHLEPVHAELVCGERTVLSCELEDFSAGAADTKEG